MRKLTMLLALSGSEQSLHASRCAFSLAKTFTAKILALHVVDTRSAWALLGYEKPGLIGSGLYIQAYESLCGSMRNLANKLMEKFEAVAGPESVDLECLIDEGNPVHEICQRAKDCDFIVIGHQPSGLKPTEDDRNQFIRRSIAEGVIHEATKPVLLVQGESIAWKTLKILVSIDHINVPYIRACHMAAHMMGVKAEIVCLTTGVREETPQHFIKDLRKAYPDLKHIPVSFRFLNDQASENTPLWSHKPIHVELQAAFDELFIVPTRSTGAHRITIFGSVPELFVRHLTLPNILFWPEEHVDEWTDSVVKEGLSDRMRPSYTVTSR